MLTSNEWHKWQYAVLEKYATNSKICHTVNICTDWIECLEVRKGLLNLPLISTTTIYKCYGNSGYRHSKLVTPLVKQSWKLSNVVQFCIIEESCVSEGRKIEFLNNEVI